MSAPLTRLISSEPPYRPPRCEPDMYSPFSPSCLWRVSVSVSPAQMLMPPQSSQIAPSSMLTPSVVPLLKRKPVLPLRE